MEGVQTSLPGPDDFYREILDSLADGVYFVDRERRITYWNRGAERISGYRREEVVGRTCWDNLLVHTDARGCQLCLEGCPLLATLRDGENREADVFLKHREGHRVPVSVRVSPILDGAGRITGGVEVFSDNSAKLAAIEKAAEMERLALIDPLTGVGNRRYAESVLKIHDARFRREGERYGVLFADLDDFKAVNDACGHEAGDAVLRAVARTLAYSIRGFDFAGRWGGDEFIVVLAKADEFRAEAAAARCRALVNSCSVDWSGRTIRPSVSIGAAAVRPGERPSEVVARADVRALEAKHSGGVIAAASPAARVRCLPAGRRGRRPD